MYREVELRGVGHQLVLPPAHRLAAPAGHGILVDALALVGDDQVLVDADDLAVALAAGAGSQRVVEAEEVLGGGLELDAVGFEARGVLLHTGVGDDAADPSAVGEGPRDGVAQTRLGIVVGGDLQPVDDHRQPLGRALLIDRRQEILDEHCPPVDMKAQQAVGQQQRQLLDEPLPLVEQQRGGHGHTAPRLELQHPLGHLVDPVAAHLAARDGREGVAHAGEEELQIVVDFGRRADGRARVARVDLLLDGDGGSDARDKVDVGLADFAQKLAGIGRKALDVAPLPLGKDGIEGQRRLARARETRDDDQRVVGDFHVDVLEVVDARPLDDYRMFLHFVRFGLRLCRAEAPPRRNALLPAESRDAGGGGGHAPPTAQGSSTTLPSALRSRSTSRSARLSRMRSSSVQRLSKRWATTVGCSSLTTFMMPFIAA